MKRVPTARDCMGPVVLTLYPEQDVFEAIDLLVAKAVSGAPVVDGAKQLAGILTEKDCLRVLSGSSWGALEPGKVCNFMSPVRAVVEPNQDLFTVVQTFLDNNFPSLPVVENGLLVGTISRQNVLRGIQVIEHEWHQGKLQAERTLRVKQSPSSIEDLQVLAASERPEHLAALLRMRHDDH